MHAPSFSTPLLALDAVVIDTETTGLDARAARIVQIGAVRLRAGALAASEKFETLLDPGGPIPPETVAVHHITDAMVAGAPRFSEIAAGLEAFVGSSILIGHSIAYDLTVLRREYETAGRTLPGFRALDVRMLARLAAPSLADHGLDRLCEWLGIAIEGRHTAVGDAMATARVFLALVPILRNCNIRTLAEAEAASRRLSEQEALATGGSALVYATGSARPEPVSQIDSFPYRHRVGDVMTAPPVTAPPGTTIAEAARLLIDKKVSSVLVADDGRVIGIVTERDLLRALDRMGGEAFARPIGEIARGPLQTVAVQDFVYRAIGRMERLQLRHLGVTDGSGAVVGAVTTRNLLRHRATTAIVLGDEISSATSSAALGAAWAKLPLMARRLMAEEVGPRTIAAVVSSEICTMTRRAAELAEARMQRDGPGAPPVPYAVMVLGSGGRGESQLAADQDNAIVYAAGAEGGAEDRYFATLAGHMCDLLDEAGIPNCKGGVMARNRAWRMDVDDWHAQVDGWVRHQRPQDLLNVDIFFDALPVHGDARLAEAVWSHAFEQAHRTVDFQKLLTENARRRGSAFTLLGGFRVDGGGRIDLKLMGLLPIFSAARVLAIRHDVRARSTVERLQGVAATGHASPDIVQSILDAHETILGAVIGQQLADTERGVPLSPKVAIARLGKAEKAGLKQALSAVDEVLGLVSEGRL